MHAKNKMPALDGETPAEYSARKSRIRSYLSNAEWEYQKGLWDSG